eukprot:jgi/Picsp_1/2697/NSC_00927-R1_nicotinamide n-methyltransferase nnt1
MGHADKITKVERFTFGPYDLDVLCRRHLDQTLNFKLTVQCSKESMFESLRDFGGGMPSSDSDEERYGEMPARGKGESLVGDMDLLGLDIWPAAIILCQYLERHWSQLIKGQSVIELGAGIGLPCLLCARMGASKAVITDYDPKVVSHVSENAKKCSVPDLCQGLRLDWTKCDKDAAGHEQSYGVVLAADILYDGGIVKDLVDTVEYVMEPSGLLLISHQQRRSLVLDDLKIPTVVEEDVSFQTFRKLILARGFFMRILGERESPGFPGSMMMLGFSRDKERLESMSAYPEMNTLF